MAFRCRARNVRFGYAVSRRKIAELPGIIAAPVHQVIITGIRNLAILGVK